MCSGCHCTPRQKEEQGQALRAAEARRSAEPPEPPGRERPTSPDEPPPRPGSAHLYTCPSCIGGTSCFPSGALQSQAAYKHLHPNRLLRSVVLRRNTGCGRTGGYRARRICHLFPHSLFGEYGVGKLGQIDPAHAGGTLAQAQHLALPPWPGAARRAGRCRWDCRSWQSWSDRKPSVR